MCKVIVTRDHKFKLIGVLIENGKRGEIRGKMYVPASVA